MHAERDRSPQPRRSNRDDGLTFDIDVSPITGHRPEGGPFDLDDPSLFLNREQAELAYQQRVLHEARDTRNPLLERAKFMAFFTKNIDEFFMKRVGGLKQQIDAGITTRSLDGRTPHQQMLDIHEKVRPMFLEQAACFEDEIVPQLAVAGIRIARVADLTDLERKRLRQYFENSILPVLTPLTVGPTNPFPFISNLSVSVGVFASVGGSAHPIFTRVKVPQRLPGLVPVANDTFAFLEDVIAAHLDIVMPGVEVLEVSTFRITRNAEVSRNEEVAEDLIEMIEEVIELRRYAETVRLEVASDMSEAMADLLVNALDVRPHELYRQPGPLDYQVLFELDDLGRNDLMAPRWEPTRHPRLTSADDAPVDIFAAIREEDILLHHPYHSFDSTVERFLARSARDPKVLAIKAAIYRTASESRIIETLITAAREGKQVAVMVELKARFDEAANIEWVRQLEEHGIHVAYGKLGLKTHTKAALVVRRDDDGVRLYSHIGTGNYHAGTARTYVDLGILTVDRAIGQDLVKVFNYFTGPALDDEFRKLLIAPVTMRESFEKLIQREIAHAIAGRSGHIIVKINALEDPGMVRALYRASSAGVSIDVIARDICRLRPGIAGLSDNVSVHSLVGRFLEHSRIFAFENGGDPEYYIGSADLMTRNLDGRVEAVAPVDDPRICEELGFILDTMLHDNRRRWVMDADGEYTQIRAAEGEPERDTQSILMERAAIAAGR